MTRPIDPVDLTRDLIRRPSVTPTDAGALDVLEDALKPMGFVCRRMPFSEPGTPDVDNLYARLGTGGKHICFAGHTDVVPVGDAKAWRFDPFAAEVADGMVYGRGAVDMKTAIACFAAASQQYVAEAGDGFNGSISVMITGDEEGPAINGTKKMLEVLAGEGETWDGCIVGEPTNPEHLGEMIKIGRRGSLNGVLTVTGTQGHTAYPHLADNPVPRAIWMLREIVEHLLDQGSEHFQPSTLEITTVDVGNPATNVIPATVTAGFNVRFNDLHSGASVEKWIRDHFNKISPDYDLEIKVSGESFLTPPGPLSDALRDAAERVTRRKPELSTSGGTSDARFIKDYCPVAEFGLMNETAHKVDERVAISDINDLTEIYRQTLKTLFEAP